MLLENFYNSFLSYLESHLSGRFWLWKLTFFCIIVSLFLAFPPYTLLTQHFSPTGAKLDAWRFIKNQSVDLLHPRNIGYDIRRENMIYRWFLPFLSYVTNHNILLILLLQATCGVLFVERVGRFVYEISRDKIATALFVLSISNIFVIVWTFADVHGYGDGFAYFFLLLAIFARNPFLVFLSLQIAFFTDERAVLAGGYILLWSMVTRAFEKEDFGIQEFIKNTFLGRSSIVWVAWGVYFAIRYYVGITYFPQHHYSTLGTPVLFADAHRNGLGSSIWSVFEGMWLVLGSALIVLILTKRYWIIGSLVLGFSVLVVTAIFVHDIDRAMSYGFPFLLMAIFVLFKTSSLSSIRLILFFSAVICVSHPQVFYMGYNKILWLEPFPLKVIMYFDQIGGWGMFD